MSDSAMSDSARVHLVFGAYGGIGSALARRLAHSGVQLAVSGRDSDRLDALAVELGAWAAPADASDFEDVEEAVSGVVERFGRLDGVTNCVGSFLLKPAHLTRSTEWHETLAANLTSAFAVLRASVKLEAIAAAKGGIDALVRSAGATYGPAGIRVNAVAPGLVETPLTARISSNDKARSASEAMHALGRLGTAEDVAAAMHWLLSDEASWVTGQTLGVDGGLGRVRSA
ncbi:MAG: SDR family oxidoreductase [Gemmatimonadota bacterium]